MADNATQQGANVSASDEELSQLIRTELEKDRQAQALKTNTPYTPPPPEPLKLKVDGKEFQFKDTDELSNALQAAFDQQRTREAQLQQQVTSAATPAPVKKKKDDDDDKPAWEFNTYVEKMGKDPREAQDYLDEHRFGFNPVKKMRKLEKQLAEAQIEIENSRRERVANGFRDAHPEFPGSPESAAVIDHVMQNMGYEFNPAGLEAAYAIAQTKGWIKPLNQQQEDMPAPPGHQQGPAQPTFGRQTNVPPRVGRSASNVEPDIFAQAENMNADQLEALLQRYSQSR